MPKRNLILIALPLVLLVAWAAFRTQTARAAAPDPITGSSITVNGTGTVEVAPNEALVTIGAEEDATSAAQAQAALARDTDAMEKTILAAGIAKEDIATSGYDLAPSYDKNGKVDGYRASSDFTVTVHKLASLGSFLDAMVQAGSNRIDSIRFERSDSAVYQRQALQKAVADAQAKAQAVAAQLGRSLGPVIKVTENSPNIVPIYQENAPLVSAGAAPSPAVEPGQLKITATVTLENSD